MFNQTASASPKIWKDSANNSSQYKQLNSNSSKNSTFDNLEYRAMELNLEAFKNQYVNASSAAQKSLAGSTINIPLPQGGSVSVILTETSLMAPELAAQHPNIKTWKASNSDGISGRVDFTENGFHAMLTLPDGDTVFIEPETLNNSNQYLSFSKQNNPDSFKADFQCDLHPTADTHVHGAKLVKRTAEKAASDLISYRLAVATTGEYTQFFGSESSAFSNVVTTINRVNEIYERDLAITFQLINEERDLIYSNPNTDPYSNFNSDALLDENVATLSNSGVLDTSRYDIGHVFSTGSGGLATLGSVCSDFKAEGTTGITEPRGEVFAIDFVAHEIGHQLGANHTFNSETGSCGGNNRWGPTAVEPGSGSTIMAYAGICGENNISAAGDAAFHSVSLEEIFSFSRGSSNAGSSCGTRTSVSNQDPEPNAGADGIIPAHTPFVLSGSANDSDDTNLTYSWEQNDAGTASDIDVDRGDNAIIRSFLPISSSSRFIPRLTDIFQARRLSAEKLPETSRDLNFFMTVRDGRGGFDFDKMKLQVVNTGVTFSVTSHSSTTSLSVGENTQVNWEVAGTATSPINCNSVNIDLIKSNGSRLGLKQQTANDGSETVTIPSNAAGFNDSRIMVICSNNASTFFNISESDLTITGANNSGSDPDSNGGSNSSSGGGGSFDYFLLILLLLGLYKMPVRQLIKIKINKDDKK
ncbi:MAG: M12 family metallo-peptidase [Cocleimonas sp.]